MFSYYRHIKSYLLCILVCCLVFGVQGHSWWSSPKPAEHCMNMCNEENCKKNPSLVPHCQQWCGYAQRNLFQKCYNGAQIARQQSNLNTAGIKDLTKTQKSELCMNLCNEKGCQYKTLKVLCHQWCTTQPILLAQCNKAPDQTSIKIPEQIHQPSLPAILKEQPKDPVEWKPNEGDLVRAGELIMAY